MVEGIYCIEVNGQIIWEENHIGKPDIIVNSENIDEPLGIE